MRGRLVWLLGGVVVAGAALWRAFARARPPDAVAPGPDPRAAELRRKLAESRAIVSEREEFESAETSVDQAEPAPEVDDRRRRVHEEGRAAARRMRRPPEA